VAEFYFKVFDGYLTRSGRLNAHTAAAVATWLLLRKCKAALGYVVEVRHFDSLFEWRNMLHDFLGFAVALQVFIMVDIFYCQFFHHFIFIRISRNAH